MIEPLFAFIAQVRPVHIAMLIAGPLLLFSLTEYIDTRKPPSLKLLISSLLYSVFLLGAWLLLFALWNSMKIARFEPAELIPSMFIATLTILLVVFVEMRMDRPKDAHPIFLVMGFFAAILFSLLLSFIAWAHRSLSAFFS